MLTVEINMYAEDAGGRSEPIHDVGYSCDCIIDPAKAAFYTCRVNFYGKYPIVHGEKRRADIFFLTGDDAEAQFSAVQHFFLRENGSIVGRATAYSLACEIPDVAWAKAEYAAKSSSLANQGVPGSLENLNR